MIGFVLVTLAFTIAETPVAAQAPIGDDRYTVDLEIDAPLDK